MHTYLKFNRAHSDALSRSLVRIELKIIVSVEDQRNIEPVLNLLEPTPKLLINYRKNSVSGRYPMPPEKITVFRILCFCVLTMKSSDPNKKACSFDIENIGGNCILHFGF